MGLLVSSLVHVRMSAKCRLGGLGGVRQVKPPLAQSRDRSAPGKESYRHRGIVCT